MKRKSLISRVIHAEIEINNQIKYTSILAVVTAIHLCLSVLFFIFRITPLTVLNVASIGIYLWLECMASKSRFVYCFWGTVAEVLVNSTVSTFVMGWQAGFVLYILGMLPVSFYMVFTVAELKKQSRQIMVSCCISVAVGVAVLVASGTRGPLCSGTPHALIVGLCIFNFLVAYGIVGMFTFLFVMEIRGNERILQRKNRELDRMAGYDYLTGLYNRRSMRELLKDAEQKQNAGRNGGEYTVILADIDDFKSLNDRFGHECGDMVLKTVCGLMREMTGEKGYVSRWGGEEILFLCRLDLEETRKLAEDIRRAVESSVLHYNGRDIRCTVTMGVAVFDGNSQADGVINAADENMYRGKSRSKNCVIG